MMDRGMMAPQVTIMANPKGAPIIKTEIARTDKWLDSRND